MLGINQSNQFGDHGAVSAWNGVVSMRRGSYGDPIITPHRMLLTTTAKEQ